MIKDTQRGIEVDIYVQPNSSKSELAGIFDQRLKLKLHSPPVDNAANEEVIEFFKKKLGVSKSQVHLISGEKNRRKRILIESMTAAEFSKKLNLNPP